MLSDKQIGQRVIKQNNLEFYQRFGGNKRKSKTPKSTSKLRIQKEGGNIEQKMQMAKQKRSQVTALKNEKLFSTSKMVPTERSQLSPTDQRDSRQQRQMNKNDDILVNIQ